MLPRKRAPKHLLWENSACEILEARVVPASSPSTVSIIAQVGIAIEGGPDAELVLTRSGGTLSKSLKVKLNLAGTADKKDIEKIKVRFESDQQEVRVPITAKTDSSTEGTETLTLSVKETNKVTPGSTPAATVELKEIPGTGSTLPQVSASVTNSSVNENSGESRTIRLIRTGDTTTGLTVKYSLSGSATNGVDYTELSGTATIPAGQSQIDLQITPILDSNSEGTETVILTVLSSPDYFASNATPAQVSITELTTLTISRSRASVSEYTGTTAFYTVTRTGDLSKPLTVNLEFSSDLSSHAENGVDFNLIPATVILPAGQSSVDVNLIPIDDFLIEGPETAVLNLVTSPEYAIGTGAASATIGIADGPEGTVRRNLPH